MFSSTHSRPWQYMGVSSLLHSPAAYPKDRTPGTHLIEGWVGPRGSLIFEEHKQPLAPTRQLNSGSYIIKALFKLQNEQGSLYTAINTVLPVFLRLCVCVCVWL